ncbi:hypothetical protein Misp01_41100 [Microtetraspora sp. NBRC 13810]|uniref:DUF5107 domain-containing protein n=1 Tax=Microtetraspora sp. NBRC 13810 TaxID=3030990 RepID=UPI002553BEB6|nr:DUF5107 domain-containing protein [Microtetraspora sp. NBRC 13810]GLW08980.1 hypothetical protein Misp01_41100 [Microtetraspora sp. NBRC 13810]
MNTQPNRTRPRSAALAMALALTAAGGTVASLQQPVLAQSQQSAQPSLRVSKVSSVDDKSIDITFNKALGSDILQFTAANQVYAGQYIRISGGVAGGADAALDGRPLSQVAGTTVRPVDTPDRRTLRVVLGEGATLDGRSYELWFDGGGDQLGDLFFRSADGGVLPGSATKQSRFRGNPQDAALATVSSAQQVDSRTVDVTFAGTIWSGMPVGAYTGSDITLTSGDSAVRPVYVESLTGSDQRRYRLYFGADLDGAASYQLTLGTGLKLTTNAGPATAEVGASVARGGGAYVAPEIAGVRVGESGDRIEVRFNHRIAKAGDLAVKETLTGVSGTNVTADQVRGLLTFTGLTTTSGRDVAQALRDDAAYFPDASTLVIKLDSGQTLRAGARGGVALAQSAVTDVTGATSTNTAPVPVRAPRNFTSPGIGFNPNGPDYLKVNTHATTVFDRYDYQVSGDGVSVRREGVADKVVGQTIKTIEVENKYIKATFAPGYGGRLLSMIYKPTGNDLFYTNPVGTPYGFSSTNPGTPGNSPFYQNWLMVYGGVFPTLTEAEHGKYWNVPWDYKIDQRDGKFSITVTKTDDVDYPYKPSRYVYGPTGIRTSVTYSVDARKPTLDMTVSLNNPGDQDKRFEYWTCTTLAPGAPTTSGSPTMSVVSPVKTIYRDPGYAWMESVEQPAGPPGSGLLKLDKLKQMSNWTRDGIAYGQDLATMKQGNWWGVVNHENNEGVIRVGDNTKTPGLKFWEWGQNKSFDTNVYSKGNSARPYIELWAGASPKFFTPAILKAGQTLSWTETYLPTMDLGDVTNANANGAAEVKVDASGNVTGRLFSTGIGQRLRATLVDATTGKTLDSSAFTGTANTAVKLNGKVAPGTQARLVLTDPSGATLLTAESGT